MIQRTGGWVSTEDMATFRALKIDPDEVTTEVLNMMSFRKFINYFTRQRQRQGGEPNTKFLVMRYLDYISMSAKLKVDLSNKSVRFPADCVAAHDQILPRFNAVIYEAEDNAFEEAVRPIYAKMPLTAFETDGFCIRFPQKRSDLITEGQSLKHCVGGDRYAENHKKGTRMIFFVRRAEAPDKPFFTMEVVMKDCSIAQLYGFGDCRAPKEVRRFAEKFVKALQPKKASRRKAS